MLNKNIIGLKIIKLRAENNMTMKELSEKSNISLSILNDIEQGNVFPNSKQLLNISKVFNKSIGYFFMNNIFYQK